MTATWQARDEAGEEAPEGRFRIGSEGHKQAFCRMLLDTHDRYKPAVISWPALDAEALARLTALPFWGLAVEIEGHAAARIGRMAAREPDPLLREALALMAFEEQRHKDVLSHMLRSYDIPLSPEPQYQPPPEVEWYFMRTGASECFDSFFAFGLFALARRSGYFPEDLVEVFEPVIQEEARHILFYVNWLAYAARRRPLAERPIFASRRLASLFVAARSRIGLRRDIDHGSFSTAGRRSLGQGISPRALVALCLEENDRRMARLDDRLLRPVLVPALARLALPFLPQR